MTWQVKLPARLCVTSVFRSAHVPCVAAAGISFLGLPAVPLPYKDYSAVAPSAESSVQAPAPAKASGENTVKSFVSSFIDVRILPSEHCTAIFLGHILAITPVYQRS